MTHPASPLSQDDLPIAVWEGSFTIGGCVLRCSVLDNGRRIINADDLENFFSAKTGPIDPDEMATFLKWSKGND